MLPALPKAASDLVDLGLAQIDKAIHSVGEEAIAAYIYNYYVKLDIPYVPEAVEQTIVDPMVKTIIGYAVKRIHETVHARTTMPAGSAELPPGA